MSYKSHFSRFLAADPERLHFAAHSHHLWPDVTFEAHQRAWLDAAEGTDTKWGNVMESVLPAARRHIARVVGLPDPTTIALAPNTHELVVRILSCLERERPRVLTTESEFHSFRRQSLRLEEAGKLDVTRISTEPFETFDERFLAAARDGDWDLVFVSHVFYDSGFVFQRFDELPDAVDARCFLVLDAYHGFAALPTDLSAVAERMFYVAGGYKYAMSGEGACFLHCPPGYGARPVNTGWFARFGDLEQGAGETVGYPKDGGRFLGSTFDPTPWYRFNAVMDLLESISVSVEDLHAHVRAQQRYFLAKLQKRGNRRLRTGMLWPGMLWPGMLWPGAEHGARGHFLTFRTRKAAQLHEELLASKVITDFRGDRLRFGFGLYHDPEDTDRLFERL